MGGVYTLLEWNVTAYMLRSVAFTTTFVKRLLFGCKDTGRNSPRRFDTAVTKKEFLGVMS